VTLPTRERIEDLRKRTLERWVGVHGERSKIEPLGAEETLALLDAALVLRRAEEWLRGGAYFSVEYWCESFLVDPRDHEMHGGPDLLTALKAALDAAEKESKT
jgi:hypothetical protein